MSRALSWRVGLLVVGIALALSVSACGGESHNPAHGHVAFLIGYSTDPYGNSHPNGFGVATGMLRGHVRSVEQAIPRAPPAVSWLDGRRLVVSNPVGLKGSPAALFAFRGGRLERLGVASLRPGELTFAWSPNRALIATQPWLHGGCEPGTLPNRCGIA